jgi:uncharacterized protein YodC (DUF2158 family)
MTQNTSFNIGDIVVLKSGGPEMTVQSKPDGLESFYWCQWFAGKKLERGRFPFASLKSASDSEE